MAHPCIYCGSECYCNGSLDDIIVEHTPKNCEGCGCEEFWDNEEDDFDFEDDYFEDDEEKLISKDGGLHDPNTNITHYP